MRPPFARRHKKRRSTEASREASRNNGRNSRGPTSPPGKRASALNAVSHGLSARTLVLANEDPAGLDHLRALYTQRFPLACPAEADLLEQVVAARWRLRRYWTTETALFDAEMTRQRSRVHRDWTNIDEPLRFALAFESLADEHHSLNTLNRYQARLFREYHVALRTLRNLRDDPPPFPLHPDDRGLTSVSQGEPCEPRGHAGLCPKPNLQNEPEAPLHLPPSTPLTTTLAESEPCAWRTTFGPPEPDKLAVSHLP